MKLHTPHNQESFLCYEKSKIQRQPNIFCCRITFISPRNSQINTIFTITIKCSQVTIRYGKRSKFVPKKGNLAPSDYFTCMINPLCTRNPLTGNLTNSENPDEMLHYAAFHQGLHCLLRHQRKIKYIFEIIICVPSVYTMDEGLNGGGLVFTIH